MCGVCIRSLRIIKYTHYFAIMNTSSNQHIKTFDIENKSKNRLRFSSAKERSKKASADVYRHYKRRTGIVTSATSREERVHHKDQNEGINSKKRKFFSSEKAILSNRLIEQDHSEDELDLDTKTTFSLELQLAKDRNASDLFSNMYGELSSLVGSLPEILHHAKKIVVILMRYLVSPFTDQFSPSGEDCLSMSDKKRPLYVVNMVTAEVLHLLSVLARDLRHEIHPYLHEIIMPRIIHDLINPPTNIADVKQQQILDIALTESAFRTLSYIFRYDTKILMDSETTKSENSLEQMRKYYGYTLTHKQELVRRLSAESYAPLVRKIKSNSAMKKHIRRVTRAFATSASSSVSYDGFIDCKGSDFLSNGSFQTVKISPSAKRAIDDAIDGVSSFFFFITRGVPGKLHSRSSICLGAVLNTLMSNEGPKSTDSISNVEKFKKHVIYQVVDAFLSKLREHIGDVSEFLPVWNELLRNTEIALRSYNEHVDFCSRSFGLLLQLITDCISYHDGVLVKDRNDDEKSDSGLSARVIDILLNISGSELFTEMDPSNQFYVLNLYCVSWKAFSGHEQWRSTLSIFVSRFTKGKNDTSDPIITISKFLVPHLDLEVASQYVFVEILKVAAEINDDGRVLRILHTLSMAAMTIEHENTEAVEDRSLLGAPDFSKSKCCIPLDTKQALLRSILSNPFKHGDTYSFALISYISKVLPFVLSIDCDVSENENVSLSESAVKWLIGILKDICSNANEDHNQLIAVSSLLYSVSVIIQKFEDINKHVKKLQKYLEISKKIMYTYLVQNSTSLLVLYASGSIAQVLTRFNIELHEDSNEIFELLIPNLGSDNHFMRLYSLQILITLPLRPFISDVDEVFLSGDLDDEAEYVKGTGDLQSKSSLSGMCDIVNCLYMIETTPISLQNERLLTGLINKVEVVARSGRLPLFYADAAISHMFGVLRIKFQPLWASATRAISALMTSYEESLWPRLEDQIHLVMDAEYFNQNIIDVSYETENDVELHFQMVRDWDLSKGKQITYFKGQIESAKANGRISRHLETDRMTIFEEIWAVLEALPEITAKKSRVIVPIFLEFLHGQYYLHHQDDPDAREFDLNSMISEAIVDHSQSSAKYDRETLGRNNMKKKLTSFLKMFSQVSGMQQLYKNNLLFIIFQSLLSDPDHLIAQLSLSCIFKYKLPHLLPYKEQLKGMLNKSQLREILTKFNVSINGGGIDSQHRGFLLPIITRILFGRLIARGGGSKSTKDSPAARRAAILSFVACLDSKSDEFDYFIYLMIRHFIPSTAQMRLIDCGHEDKAHFKKMIQSLASSEDRAVNVTSRLEGFLNLLGDVIKKIGFGVLEFVPVFLKIILNILAGTEFIRKSADDKDINPNSQEEEEESIESIGYSPERSNKARTLCFMRLSEIMEQFVGFYDFHDFGRELFAILGPALNSLPSSAVNAERVPSLLLLLYTMTAHSNLIEILGSVDDAVIAIFKCISCNGSAPVLKSALDCVENILHNRSSLLNAHHEQQNEGCIGLKIIRKHANLILNQFTNRIQGKIQNQNRDQLNARELNVLCHISDVFIQDATEKIHVIRDRSTLQKLADLLIPYLDLDRRLKEDSYINVLRILRSILSEIGADAAFSHLHTLSKLLGPNRFMNGIQSIEIRNEVVACIFSIAQNESHFSTMLCRVAEALQNINATDSKHIDEWDFDRVLPVINSLGEEGGTRSWNFFAGDCEQDELKVILPLMYSCFHFLYNTDGVLSRGSFKAINTLILYLSEKSVSCVAMKWFAETTLMPTIRMGLKTRSDGVRKSYILLLSRVVRNFVSNPSSLLYTDLSPLIRDDDSDLDFFLNITHVQLHRRCRALTRLRKILQEPEAFGMDRIMSTQTLSNIVMPIVSQPIYDYEKKSDEPLAIEAVATVGVIARYFSWGKYQTLLNTTLNQITRYEKQERFLIAMLCAIIDAFHFDISDSNLVRSDTTESSSILNQLNSKIIPSIERFLIKEHVDNTSAKIRSLRAPVVLALVKLLRKLPENIFKTKFPRLLTEVCNVLKHKDSDERDVARTSLAKTMTSIPMAYLSDVLREITLQLSEGYKLHVRMATLHSILNEISRVYVRPSINVDTAELYFDKCVPAMMDLIQQDIFGDANEIKEVEHVKKRLVKEAGGAKGYSALEIIGRLIYFNPSSLTTSFIPGIHALVNPLLARLSQPDVSSSVIGKVKECLNRIATGISQNSSCTDDEMLPFVYATISPYIKSSYSAPTHDGNSDDEEEGLTISGSTSERIKSSSKSKDCRQNRAIFEWNPSQLKNAKDTRMAYEMKVKQKYEFRKVLDGINAPKLTGSARYKGIQSSSGDINNPSTSCALSFALSLLNSHLRRTKSDIGTYMFDPFLEILSVFVKHSKDTAAVLLSLKCLQVLLRIDLPSAGKFQCEIATATLNILSSMAINTQSEMVQGSFKILTLLLSVNRNAAISFLDNKDDYADEFSRNESNSPETSGAKAESILSDEQMEVLVSILRSALSDAEHHNATFGVIKAIVSRHYISSDFYDLMESILNMTVQSQKPTLRHQASKIFMLYLIEYPMGKQRLETHLKQIVLNVKYEYEDGRLSAIELIKAVVSKLPIPLLEEHVQMFYLPLILQLVNDESKACKENISECVKILLSRLSSQVLQSIYDYALRWSLDRSSDGQLERIAVQLFGLFLDSKPDFMTKNNRLTELVIFIRQQLESEIKGKDYSSLLLEEKWNTVYFCFQTVEKIGDVQKSVLWKDSELWTLTIKSLVHPHPWVQHVSSRIIFSHLGKCKLESFKASNDNEASCIITNAPGSLFEMMRNLCFQLNTDDLQQYESVSTMAIKNLCWIAKIASTYPNLCFQSENVSVHSYLFIKNEEEEEDLESNLKRKPLTWLFTRLSNATKRRGKKRREVIFKCFAALTAVCDKSIIRTHLELMLQALNRELSDIAHLQDGEARKGKQFNDELTSMAELPNEVLHLLEDKCGTDLFLKTLAAVKREARERREMRKQQVAAEAVQYPEAAAKRRLEKQEKEKHRKKQRIGERRASRGVFTHRPRL